MNSKYIFIFVMSLIIGSAFVVFVNSDSDIEVTTDVSYTHLRAHETPEHVVCPHVQ